MKTHQRWVWASSLVIALMVTCLRAEEMATVKAGRINVRGLPSLNGEVITQLQQGDKVTVLEDVEASKPKPGEPAKWVKIALPANTPVWVFGPFIDTNKTVKVKQLNVRAGPGENHNILGRLERGLAVKEIRTVDSWMEIEAPAGTYAFVAVDLLDRAAAPVAVATAPPSTGGPGAAATVPAVPPPTTVETVATEPPAAAATETPLRETPAPTTPPPSFIPMVEIKPAEAVPATPTPRIVTREGRVVIAFSIQAPTQYALQSLDTFRTTYWLHSEEAAIDLRKYAGRRVILSGEEFLDERWKNTPILDVQDIMVVP